MRSTKDIGIGCRKMEKDKAVILFYLSTESEVIQFRDYAQQLTKYTPSMNTRKSPYLTKLQPARKSTNYLMKISYGVFSNLAAQLTSTSKHLSVSLLN